MILRLAALETGGNPETLVLRGNRHHGLALPAAANRVIMSVAEGTDPIPTTARTDVRCLTNLGSVRGKSDRLLEGRFALLEVRKARSIV